MTFSFFLLHSLNFNLGLCPRTFDYFSPWSREGRKEMTFSFYLLHSLNFNLGLLYQFDCAHCGAFTLDFPAPTLCSGWPPGAASPGPRTGAGPSEAADVPRIALSDLADGGRGSERAPEHSASQPPANAFESVGAARGAQKTS
jgi:hypothetical protein